MTLERDCFGPIEIDYVPQSFSVGTRNIAYVLCFKRAINHGTLGQFYKENAFHLPL